MKFRNILLGLLLTGSFSTSCINEDYSDCHNIYRLALSYLGDENAEIFPDKIDCVHMYVFDEQNRCVVSEQLSEAEVQAMLVTLPALDPGTYDIVCVGNAYETEVENLSSGDFEQIVFSAKDHIAGKTVSGNDPLYWSSIEYQIRPFDVKQSVTTETTYFKASHYDVSVDIIGVPSAADLVVKLVGVSPQTDFNNVAKGTQTTYVMDAVHNGDNRMSAVNNIMRHSDQSEVYLVIEASDGRELARISFAEHIANHPQIDVDKQECLIPFEVIFKSANVSISVPSWFIKETNPEF
ncbi:MAG: FimB/Mfa2 family fimbrial subunit [Bacteroidales bacterium]|nr:FimB/Mfa2 family fimbrial subunit [Bacteroidales bacterium]